MQEKMTHDTIDSLVEASSLFMDRVGAVPALLKADVDSAYRRIPVKSTDGLLVWHSLRKDAHTRPCATHARLVLPRRALHGSG